MPKRLQLAVPADDVKRALELRPAPPTEVARDVPQRFVPDSRFADWIKATFVTASGALANMDHEHLADASLGVLWTNAINVTKQRMVLATAEIPQTMGSAWKRARAEQQVHDWFGAEIDFLLTFYAPDMAELDNRSFCAVVEHELYHCAQAKDAYGAPRFDQKSGRPIYAIRGHDVEEFTGVVRRYGATSPDVRALVQAANAVPLIGEKPIDLACGTCAIAHAA